MKLYEHPEYKKMRHFDAWLWDMYFAGYLSEGDSESIQNAALRVWDASGIPPDSDATPEVVAVCRHEYQAMKDTTARLAPAIEHEVHTFDTRESPFWNHPLSLRIQQFSEWLGDQAHEIGVGTIEESLQGRSPIRKCELILRAGYREFRNSGLPRGPDVDSRTEAVFRKQLAVMISKTVELFPELESAMYEQFPDFRGRSL